MNKAELYEKFEQETLKDLLKYRKKYFNNKINGIMGYLKYKNNIYNI